MSSGDSPAEKRHDAADLRAAVLRGTRRLGSNAALFSQAVAERVGLASTDVECLEKLLEEGRLTAGRLAELTGLTTGAATRMIDRLEQAGFARRVQDPIDRRRVYVEPVAERIADFASLHESIAAAQRAVIDAFDGDGLAVIADFLERSADVARTEAAKLRERAETTGGGSFTAPVGAATAARLVFISGAPSLILRGEADLGDLYRATFEGSVPRVRVRGGIVTVAYPRFGWFDWRASIAGQNIAASLHWQRDRGTIALNAGVVWAVELRGGVSKLTADLRGLRLDSFDLRGGASRIEIQLPRPIGVVPIRIAGGMSQVSLVRPAGTAATFDVRGGAGHLAVDGQRIKDTGRLSLVLAGAAGASDRFAIEVAGGAGHVSLEAR